MVGACSHLRAMSIYILLTHIHNDVCVSVHAVVGRIRDLYFSKENNSSGGVAVPHLQTAWKSGRQDVSLEGNKTLFPLSVNAASSTGIMIQPRFGC